MPTTHPTSHSVTHKDTTGHQAFTQHTPAYLVLSVNAHTQALEVRCSFVPAPGRQAGIAEALALDLINAAHKRGVEVVPPAVCSAQPNGQPDPLLLLDLANALLTPEDLGYCATPEIRDRARIAIGLRPVETGLYRAST